MKKLFLGLAAIILVECILEEAVKKLFLGLAAIILAVMLFAPPAEARCWWNGYGWRCAHHHYWHARYWHPYRYRYYGWGPRYYYRPYYAYACVWPLCW